MAKQIIWTKKAHQDRKEILHYWRIHNKSNEYGKKLNLLIKKATALVAAHPHIGRRTNIENIRMNLLEIILSFMKKPKPKSIFFAFGIIEEIRMKFLFNNFK